MKVAILGYGNIGRAAEQAILSAPDMELAGIFHHDEINEQMAKERLEGQVDVMLLCTPTREVPAFAELMAKHGICTVDSFDIHGRIYDLRSQLMPICEQHKTISIISAGWDPGTDSMVRALLLAMAPKGLTYTNFGPGRSMGHTVAAKAIPGVKNALSMTIPLGTGIHRRMVYVELEDGADFKTVESKLLADDYFAHDETHVIPVDDIDLLNNVAHGVNLATHNQRFEFNMQIDNPALTGQVMVSCARAAYRMQQAGEYGCRTMIELRPIDLLPGQTENLIKSIV